MDSVLTINKASEFRVRYQLINDGLAEGGLCFDFSIPRFRCPHCEPSVCLALHGFLNRSKNWSFNTSYKALTRS